MKKLFLSYLYKLRYDLAFRITLFIGVGLAIIMSLIYFALGKLSEGMFSISGQMMFYSSLSPSENFGLAIPINLITFTVMEFNQGSIRNKIIAGNSKIKIYCSLILNGLVFAFTLLIVYALLSLGLGMALAIPAGLDNDGVLQFSECFDPNGPISLVGQNTAHYFLLKYTLVAVLVYVNLVAFTIFFATLFRNIGPSIPVVILVIVFGSVAGTVISLIGQTNETLLWVFRIVDPFYAMGASETEISKIVIDPEGNPYAIYNTIMTNETLVCGVCSNIVYAALFFFGGLFIFKKRDVK